MSACSRRGKDGYKIAYIVSKVQIADIGTAECIIFIRIADEIVDGPVNPEAQARYLVISAVFVDAKLYGIALLIPVRVKIHNLVWNEVNDILVGTVHKISRVNIAA